MQYDSKIYKKKLINTLKAFVDFCEHNHIKYYMGYGSLLGVIRHKGLIPWDDDIDVFMLREEYDRLISVKDSLIGSGFEILSPDRDEYYLPHSKFCDSNTTILELKEHRCVLGVFIDIFPLDYVSGNTDECKKITNQCRILWDKYLSATIDVTLVQFFKSLFGWERSHLIWMIQILFLYRPNRKKYQREIKQIEEGLKGRKDYLINLNAPYSTERELFLAEWFSDIIKMPFEGINVNVPVGFDNILRKLYDNYMLYPPESKRCSHHNHYFVDLFHKKSLKDIRRIMRYSLDSKEFTLFPATKK